MKKPKEQWDVETRERMTLIALSYAEISIGRAAELLGWPHDKIAKRLKEYTGATLPDGQYPSYVELREVADKLVDFQRDYAEKSMQPGYMPGNEYYTPKLIEIVNVARVAKGLEPLVAGHQPKE